MQEVNLKILESVLGVSAKTLAPKLSVPDDFDDPIDSFIVCASLGIDPAALVRLLIGRDVCVSRKRARVYMRMCDKTFSKYGPPPISSQIRGLYSYQDLYRALKNKLKYDRQAKNKT